jgi:HEAT repeat protein
MTDEEIEKWIKQLRDADYGKQLIAMGHLVEAGEAAVPALVEALDGAIPYVRIPLVSILAGIGSHNPESVHVLVEVWKKNLGDPFTNQALFNLAKKLTQNATPESIPALIGLLECHKYATYLEGGNAQSTRGTEVAGFAADALGRLAYRQPTRQLREALPHLKRNLWVGSPESFSAARKIIEEKTQQWKDLPLVAEAPKTTRNLPLPANLERDSDG